MEIADSTVRLEDADSITGLAIAVRALHAEHPSSSGLACGIGGTVWIGELAGRRTALIPLLSVPGLRLRTGDGQHAG